MRENFIQSLTALQCRPAAHLNEEKVLWDYRHQTGFLQQPRDEQREATLLAKAVIDQQTAALMALATVYTTETTSTQICTATCPYKSMPQPLTADHKAGWS
ncbi:hypothetical protein ATANTOWER_019620 [Ataeniobius toweri]|uniref:Uncharacterized protein n=1 Tax=Ataeniobius toweri TaxID=208326 RepID=A0ABU7A805_9TELE|nr:hypothetical protein [Ataeniobius toweri]